MGLHLCLNVQSMEVKKVAAYHKIESAGVTIGSGIVSPDSCWNMIMPYTYRNAVILGKSPRNTDPILIDVPNHKYGRFNLLLPEGYGAVATAYPGIYSGSDAPDVTFYSPNLESVGVRFLTSQFNTPNNEYDVMLAYGKLPLLGIIRLRNQPKNIYIDLLDNGQRNVTLTNDRYTPRPL